MSYSSRVYRQRNPHAHEEAPKEGFFSKQHDIHHVQKGKGFFQPKLAVNEPGDKDEKQADNIANQVVKGNNAGAPGRKKEKGVQRQAVDREKRKEVQTKLIQRAEPVEKEEQKKVQTKEEPKKEDEEMKQPAAIQKKESSGGSQASPQLSARIESSAGGGSSLPENTLNEMNTGFRSDFSKVKIHTDSEAVKMNRELNAQAFTHGKDIYFNEHKFSPGESQGKLLLAHELTHVIQQTEGEQKDEQLQRTAIHQGNILDEGSCAHLACNSIYACDDPDGVVCPEKTKWAGKSKKPLFTCDKTCEQAGGCSDTANWMAIPKGRFKFKKCDQDLVICANGKFTHVKVRDKSEKEAWEVSHGVQDDLGVNPYAKFKGSIYADESDAAFKKDKNCSSK